MSEYAKNLVELSFQNLAKLCGIPLKQGWKAKLIEKLDLGSSSVYTWISRGRIPTRLIEIIEEAGYPRDKWLIPEAMAWYERKREEVESGIEYSKIVGIYERLHALLKERGIGIHTAIIKSGLRVKPTDDFYFLGDVPDPRDVEKICTRFGIDKEYVWSGVPSAEENEEQASTTKTEAFRMLHDILDSNNERIINAVMANLEALTSVLKNEKSLRAEMQEVRERIEALERSRNSPEPESNAA